MEVGNGFIEGFCGVVPQQPLEAAKGPARGGKERRALRRLITDGVLHKGIHPPGAVPLVGVVGLSIFGAEDLQSLPAPVPAVLLNLLPQVVGDTDDVLHELVGPLEGGGAHALENEPAAAAVVRLGVDHKGVVDVARAEADGPHHRRAKVKGPQDLAQILFCGGHYFTSQSWSG